MTHLGKASVFWSLGNSWTVLNYHRNHKKPFPSPVMTRVFLMHVCMLEHLGLNLFFSWWVIWLICMSSLGSGFISLAKGMDFIYTWIPFKKSFRKKSKCPAKQRNSMVLDSYWLNHCLETSNDDHTSLYNLLYFQREIALLRRGKSYLGKRLLIRHKFQ